MTNYIPVFILNELIILPNQDIKIDISNETSKKIIKLAIKNNNGKVLVIAPKNSLESAPSIEDLPKVGVIAKIKSKLELSNGSLRIVLRGKKRVSIDKYFQNRNTFILKCATTVVELPSFDTVKVSAVTRKLISLTKEYINLNDNVSNSIIKTIDECKDIDLLTDIITSFMPFNYFKKLFYMETINPLIRANSLINDLQEEISISNIDKELDERLQENLESSQREYILKEKLKEINSQLGNTKEEEINNLLEVINSLNLDIKSHNKLLNEVKKYSSTTDYSPESAIIKNYLDTVLSLPWNKTKEENLNIKEINSILNDSHYGLEEIKERIIEYATLKKKNSNLSSPIICLVGPPGVGKTSIAMSVANALNRDFYKISVGGLNDSLELVGSRKTYVGAAPGKIVQALIKCQSNNPIILIDEVDKMVKDYKGDPASTLLEILDETQNKMFIDNYIEEPFDLSKIMFILTANDIELIPKTLFDRLEIINLDSYSIYEKVDIAKDYLIKDILNSYNSSLKISKETIEYIVTNYTKEPGVRELKRCLEKIIRKVIVNEPNAKSITNNMVNKYFKNPINHYLPSIRDYGITNVLAYTKIGGLVSHVEVEKYQGTGKVLITGNTGDILKESVNVVISFLKSKYEIEVNNLDLHIHFLDSALKKDGPSAGASIAIAILSLIQRKVIDQNVACTGEITLKGEIMPVGGLKDKLMAAYENGITTVFVPRMNEEDLIDIPLEILEKVNVKFVTYFDEIYDVLFR